MRFAVIIIAGLALGGCGAGKAVTATGDFFGRTADQASNAALRATGFNPKAGLTDAPSINASGAHWSEEWVWEGDGEPAEQADPEA
ncbi:MAG: hypothetical protein AAF788_01475 [Pseudomonadota bacterium]